jgi:hypothetical protein
MVRMGTGGSEEERSAGDPVCWLAVTCDECGAFVEETVCWRCGTPREEHT